MGHEKYSALLQERDWLVARLAIANAELAFQSNEKEKRADELAVANIELEFQSSEKEKRADELAIANTELEFQSTEKEKRADELAIANIELEFQSAEKEKRADELIVERLQQQGERVEIYLSTVQATQHILNNLLNQLLLVRMAAVKSKDFDPKVLKYFDLMTTEAKGLIGKLSNVKKVSKQNISSSVYPE
jgi:hypothetical protein